MASTGSGLTPIPQTRGSPNRGSRGGVPDKVFEGALEAGAEDVSSDEGHEIWCSIDSLHEVAKALEPVLGEAEGIKLAWRPQTQVTLTSVDEAALLMKL